MSGIVRMADQVLVERNPDLPFLSGCNGSVPIYLAVLYKHKNMAYYLLSVTDLARLKIQERIDRFHATISSDYYG